MAVEDKLLGGAFMAVAAVVFGYYTVWTLITVSLLVAPGQPATNPPSAFTSCSRLLRPTTPCRPTSPIATGPLPFPSSSSPSWSVGSRP